MLLSITIMIVPRMGAVLLFPTIPTIDMSFFGENFSFPIFSLFFDHVDQWVLLKI